jgi:GT2 family glycosyltransferase
VTRPRASIVLVTRNGGLRLQALLDAIDAQQGRADVEIVAVDSSSTDGTRERLEARADVVVDITPAEFNHGITRNLGIARASGPIAVLLVQDAVPQSDRWLDALITPLERDPRLAGTFARQVPCASASAVTRHQLAHWVATRAQPRVVFCNRGTFEALGASARLDLCAFDNVCAALRRDVWDRHPLPATPIAEDVAWAREVLLGGYGLAFVPDAVVEHSHERSAWYELKRTWALHRQLDALFALRTVPSTRHLVRAVASSMALHRRLVAGERGGARAYGRAAALAVAWPLGQYLGGSTAFGGRGPLRPRGV